MLGKLTCLFLCFPWTEARIWAWMLNMPHSPPSEGVKATCYYGRACGWGYFCDQHFGLCVPLRGEGHFCQRDAECLHGLICMFGKCQRRIPPGYEGARCKDDRDCGASLCCAWHHGEQVCKRRLIRGESCYVAGGGPSYSITQICPCDQGLLCRQNTGPHLRERDFIYEPAQVSWTCQVGPAKCSNYKTCLSG